MPAIFSFLKKVLSYDTWRITKYERNYDGHYEFYPGHHTERDAHVFTVENVSNRSWTLKEVSWNGGQSDPYLFISKEGLGLIWITNEQSYEKVDPSQSFNGDDFPVGAAVLAPKDCIKVTLQHTEDLSEKPLDIHFEGYSDSNNIMSRLLKVSFLRKSKFTLCIP